MGLLFSQENQKFHLTPPRIYLPREDYFVVGHIKAGQNAKRVSKDFICPAKHSFGGTLLLTEEINDDTIAQCDADIAGGVNGAEIQGGIRIANKQFLTAANFSNKFIDLGIMSTPTSILSVFAKGRAVVGDTPELEGGFIWRPTYQFKQKDLTNILSPNSEKVSANIGTRSDYINTYDKPKPRSTSPVVGGTWKSKHSYVKKAITFDSALRLYGKLKNNNTIVGSHVSLQMASLFTEFVGEVNTNTGDLVKSDIGCSWVLQNSNNELQTKKQPVGNLEVSCVLENVHHLFEADPNITLKQNEEPKAVLSFYKHLVIPRRIMVATDYRNKLISNYIDIAVQLGVNPKKFTNSYSNNTNNENYIPVDMCIASSWQLNKNNLLKLKIDQNSASFSYTAKAWWQPRFCFTTTLSHDFKTNTPSFGFWFVVDTNYNMEHETAHSTYSDSVGTSIVDHIASEDKDYV